MLRPDIQWKNPVMFVVEVGTVLTILYTVAVAWVIDSQAAFGYLIALDVWLFLTVLFANFAEALAEARGKAQADALRKTRQATPAYPPASKTAVVRADRVAPSSRTRRPASRSSTGPGHSRRRRDRRGRRLGRRVGHHRRVGPGHPRGRRRPLRRHRRHARAVRPHRRAHHGRRRRNRSSTA